MKKIILFLAILIIPIFIFLVNTQPVFAEDNSALIMQLEQEIESLMKQIIALMQQQQQPAQIQTQAQTSNAQAGKLTVNATGVTAYVSINNGPQFAYVSPIILNNGDMYSVTASSNNSGTSTSKCSGTASTGGSYVCNISISQ